MTGWPIRRLGDVCRVRRGTTITQKQTIPGDIPVVGGGMVPTYFHNEANRPAGTITVSGSGASAGYVNRYQIPIFASDCSTVESLDEKVLSRDFVFMFLQSQQDWINSELRQGAAQPHVYASDIAAIEIPVPPLEEQRRIVAVLDEAFAAIATATANAQKNLANARELFESCLEDVFDSGGPSWNERPLGEVCRFVGGSQPPKAVFSPTECEGMIRLIQIRDYKSDRHKVFIPKTLAKRFCAADDVMIGRYGPPLFQILRGLDGAYNVALMKAAADTKIVSKDFLYFFIRNARLLRHVVAASDRAAGQIGLTKETLEPYPIKYPSLPEQERVVDRLSEIEAESIMLKEAAIAKLSALAALKQSLLHRAFTGQLTATPDLIPA